MKPGEKIVFELYGLILQRLVRSNMASHEREHAIKQALTLALEAAEHFAKLVEDKE